MNIYQMLVTIPDRLYPFGGLSAYTERLLECRLAHGYEFKCLDLFLYREAFHFLGALAVLGVFLLIKTYVRKRIALGGIIAFALYILLQESYLQPLFEGQAVWKGAADTLVWLVTIGIGMYVIEMKKWHHEIFVFIKSNIASILATVIDYIILIICYKVIKMPLSVSVMVGLVIGGASFFLMGHRWVFDPTRTPLMKKGWKFFFVWLGSFGLNTEGTVLFFSLLKVPFVFARMLASLAVGLLWNYPLNRLWVFGKRRAEENS